MRTIHAWILYLSLGVWGVAGAEVTNTVAERGPHHRVIEDISRQKLADGRVTETKSKRVELATGIHYLDGEAWVETRELIEADPDGAIAHYGQHKAAFAANLNTYGAIQVVDADGKKFTSHLLGLSYTDTASGKSVLIAQVKDCVGQIIPPNQIVYNDAFSDFRADVRYTYTRSGFEQDIILRGSPPLPTEYGLDPATTRMEVLTEFVEAPAGAATTEILKSELNPAKRRGMAVADFIDQELKFGALKIGKGKAIDLQGVLASDIPVGKTWEVFGGRSFLIEAVEVSEIEPALKKLPRKQASREAANRMAAIKSSPRGQILTREFPSAPRQRAALDRKPMKQMAQIDLKHGVLLDYAMTLDSGQTNFVFEPWATHHVLGPVDLYGTTTFRGGTVVKYAAQANNPYISLNGSVVCDTAPYRPAVFTAADDHSIGTQLNYNGLAGYYAVTALRASTTVTGELHDLRFNFANTAIDWNGSTQRFSNLQFMNCSNAIRRASAGTNQVHNILATNVLNLFSGSNFTVNAQHVTANRVGTLSRLTGSPARITLTNCVLINVTNLGTGTITGDYLGTNGTPAISGVSHGYAPSSPVFQNSAGGDHYLVTNSSLRDVGTTNIAPNLLAELRLATTRAPQYFANTTITVDTVLSVSALRDTNGPDLGYHYAPLDFVVSGCEITSDATAFLTNGVAVGVDYALSSWGFIFDSGHLLSVGSPVGMNRIVRAHCVQERSGGNPGSRAMFYDKGDDGGPTPGDSSARFRFTEFSAMVEDGYTLFVGTFFKKWEWTHCHLFMMSVEYAAYNGGIACGVTNNIFDYSSFDFYGGGSSSIAHMRNNTMHRSALALGGGNTNWTVRDNLFDSMVRIDDDGPGTVENSYNAYFPTNDLLSSGANNLLLANMTYDVGPLGKFYQSANSPLANAGSRNSTNAGLYHYTTTTNQVPETNSVVDIGFHYAALNVQGLPLDSDNDGIPNYIEDANGNGTIDNGETPFTSLSVSLISPLTNTNYTAPATVVFNAYALAPHSPVVLVEYYHGTTKIGQATTPPFTFSWNGVPAGVYTSLTARATAQAGLMATSAPVTIYVNNALHIVGSTPSVHDDAVTARLRSLGFYPHVLLDSQATAAGDGVGKRLVFISRGTSAGNLDTDFSTLAVPLISRQHEFYPDLGLTGTDSGTDYDITSNNESNIVVTATNNSMAAGLNGTNIVALAGTSKFSWGKATNSAVKVAYWAAGGTNKWAIFGYESNATIVGITAPSRRVGFFFGGTNLTTPGWNLFDAAVQWVTGTNAPPKVDWVAPTNSSTYIGSTNITLRAQATDHDSGIKKVNFYDNGVRVGIANSISNTTYSFVWSNVVGGQHFLTAKAFDNGNLFTVSTQFINISVKSNVLLVTASNSLNVSDLAVKARLETNGFVVTAKAATNTTAADANGKTLVLISGSALASSITNRFTTSSVPVLLWQKDLFDDMGMTGTNATNFGTTGEQTQISIINSNHPMAAGLIGTVTVVSNATNFSWAVAGSNAIRIASITTNSIRSVIFGYEKGVLMSGLGTNTFAAPARRVGFLLTSNNAVKLDTNGWALFDAAVRWAIEKPCFTSIELMLAMDVSQSLTAEDFQKSKNAASNFVSFLNFQSDRIGLVSFAGTAVLEQVLTTNGPLVQSNITALTDRSGTVLDAPVSLSQSNLDSGTPGARKIIIILSDGKVTDNTKKTNALNAANTAKNKGTTIISLGYGNDTAGQDLLKQLASSPTDYYQSPDVSDMGDVYAAIADALCRFAAPPIVAITEPPTNSIFAYPTNIQISAIASDIDGAVMSVAFYAGTDLLGIDTSAPFAITWMNPAAGSYTLTAIATDNSGLKGTSGPVVISIRQAPTVTIITPTNSQSFNAIANITLTSAAQDIDGYVTNVTYFVNDVLVGNSVMSPYSLTVSNLYGASYALKAVATDNTGLSATSVVVNISVLWMAPTISILWPTNGSTFAANSSIPVQTAPVDVDGVVQSIALYTNNVLFEFRSISSGTNFLWNPPAAGIYTLRAYAIDDDDLEGWSQIVTISVASCAARPPLTNFTLSTNTVLGGTTLTGKVMLASGALPGGQSISFLCTNTTVLLPPSVLLAEGTTMLQVPINTTPVGVTNLVTIIAVASPTNMITNVLTIIPGSGIFETGGTNQSAGIFTTNLNVINTNDLVRLIVGPEVIFSKVEYVGQHPQAGIFMGGNGIIGFDQGLILSSGDIANAGGSNTLDDATFDWYTAGDSDLNSLVPGTRDAAVLKFEFIPVGDFVTWEYVFASEEYNFYVGSSFNDVFGFFLNGTNVALLPNSTTKVSINNVNNGSNSQFYRDNDTDGNPNTAPIHTQMNGLTTVLRITAPVVPGTINRIKIAIADVADEFLDSVVMIRAGSFQTGGRVVYTRDDSAQKDYNAINLSSVNRLGTSSENADFDLRSIVGSITAGRTERAGQIQFTAGSRFDVQQGGRFIGTNTVDSYAPAFVDFQTFANPYSYRFVWPLPGETFLAAESAFGSTFNLPWVDQLSGLCGSSHSMMDVPHGTWPTNKNILTLLVLGRRDIAQGRCQDFVLSATNAPINGQWDIVLNGEIVASAGNPNGWSVEADYTVFGGYNICAPTNALPAPVYEVRIRGTQGSQSGIFSVVAAGSRNGAPVLYPLILSPITITTQTDATLTVSLDAPAPTRGVYVTLTADGVSSPNLPAYVFIPGGERTASVVFSQSAGANGTLGLLASYNGYRRNSAFVTNTAGSAPGTPINLSASVSNGRVILDWNAVTGATGYNITRSNSLSAVWERIYSNLPTNHFVDANVFGGVTYYYTVSATNRWGASVESSIQSVLVPYQGPVAAPWIIPFGGTFNDSVAVILTNYYSGSRIHYTTNGDLPTGNSPYFTTSGTIILGSNATIRAFATNDNFLQASPVVSATFSVVRPIPMTCSSTIGGSLGSTNSWSIYNGVGFYGQRFSFQGTAGKLIQATTFGGLDTVLFLSDGTSTNLLALNDDYQTNDYNSRILFIAPSNGTYVLEVSSWEPQAEGTFSLELLCLDRPEIVVFTNYVYVTNSTTVTNRITLTNLAGLTFAPTMMGSDVFLQIGVSNAGVGALTISNVAGLPTNFYVAATFPWTVDAGQATNITVRLVADFVGRISGYLTITSDDVYNGGIVENPFYVLLNGEIFLPPANPRVELIFPTNGMVIPDSPVNIQLYAAAFDEGGIQRVDFYQGTTFIASNTATPYAVWWSNVASGVYALTAVAIDNANNRSTSTVVNLTVGSPTIVLSPTNPCVGLSNGNHTVTATVRDVTGALVNGASVTFTITGAHVTNTAVSTASGIAALTYTGRNAGRDRIEASVTVGGQTVSASPVFKPWAAPISCGTNFLAALSESDPFSAGCGCAIPSRYADFYSITGNLGETLTFIMKSTNINTYMLLLNTNCQPVATNEALNASDTRLRYTLPAAGTYILEATSFEIFQTGGYSISNFCGAAGATPDIGVRIGGTNVSNGTWIDLGTTNVAQTISLNITITNQGTATLNINGLLISDVLSFTANPLGSIAAGSTFTTTLQFNSSAVGRYPTNIVRLTSDDPDENPFDLYFVAIANPSGTAPTVAILTPTNDSKFIVPASVAVMAGAAATGATITNVDFWATTLQGSVLIGRGTNATNTIIWNSALPGAYSLVAVASDSAGRITASFPVRVELQPQTQNHPPIAVRDTPTVPKNSENNVLNVLSNDTDADGDALIITSVLASTNATVEIVNNGTAIRYTPRRNVIGSDGFTYQITDNKGGVSSAFVLVTIESAAVPVVTITIPSNPATVTAGTLLTLEAQVNPWQNVTNLEFFIGDVRIAQITNATSSTFSTNWVATMLECNCGLYARATDRFGQVGYSAYVSIHINPPAGGGQPPVAKFDSLTTTTERFSENFTLTNLATVRDGIVDVIGRAYDSDSADDAWRLQLYSGDGRLLRDLTPGPVDVTGFRSEAVGSATSSNLLTTCDLTTVQNGIYELVLSARGGYRTTQTRFRFRLESDLKIGQFSFSEQDLVIPVNGLPLTVVRTYNSQNPKQGDFGYSWTYSILGMEIELDEERIPVRDIDGTPLSLRVGGGRNVTLTLPNGRRATFAFSFVSGGGYRLVPQFTAPPGINAKLEVTGYHPLDAINVRWLNDGTTSFEWYEFPGYTLTLEDGTRYIIERGPGEDYFPFTNEDDDEAFDATVSGNYSVTTYAPPYLSKIIQRSGDTIEIERPQFNNSGSQTFRILHKDALGNLTRSVYFERDAQGRVMAVRDPIGGSNGVPAVKYQYDTAGNLSKVLRLVDRAAQRYLTNTYFYENTQYPHYLTKIVDARGYAVARNLYDEQGRLIGIVDASGRTNRMEHDVTGRREILYDKKGFATIHVYDKRGNVTNSVNALGHTNLFNYDTNGYLLAHTDPLGNATKFSNDANGNVLSVTLPYPPGADPTKYTTRFTYDVYGQQLTVALPSGAVQTNKYDGAGNLLGTTDKDGIPIYSATFANGLQVSEIDRFGTNSFAYDSLGNIRYVTNSLGKLAINDYDANGNLTNVNGTTAIAVQYDATGRETVSDYGSGITQSNSYNSQLDWNQINGPTIGTMERRFDEQGRLAGWTTASGSTPGYAYDENGRLLYETNAIGQVTQYTYDAGGRAAGVTNLTTGAGAASFYDTAGRRIYQEDALGHGTWLGYNPDGSLAAMTNALGNFWQFSYEVGGECCGGGTTTAATDPLGRQVTEVHSPQGLLLQQVRRSGANVLSTTTTYLSDLVSPEQEAEQYPETVTDEGGRVRQFAYTSHGQLERATDLGGNWYTNQYDADSGALTNLLGPTGDKLFYVYDDLDNVKAIRFGDGQWLTNTYSAGTNRLTSVRFPSGATNALLYDSAGRVVNRVSSIGEVAAFQYNGNDVVTNMIDNTGSTTNLYDAAGRLYGINYPWGATIRYGYDLLGRIEAITNKASASGSNWVARYSYDAIGNITNVNALGQDTRYEYDRVGRRTKRVFPNGIVTDWKYDWRDSVTNIVHKRFNDGQILISFGYVRANGGEPTRITREDGGYVDLQYDAGLRLTNEVYKTSTGSLIEQIGYGYDAAGNRVRLLKGGITLTNAVNAGHRIVAINNAATGIAAENHAYDNGGRVISILRDGITRSLGYNTADQLAAATNGAAWVTYAHDAAGRRTFSTNSASVVRRFVVAGTPQTDLQSPMLIADQSGNVQQGFVYVGRNPLMRFDASGTPIYYLEDAMGSIAALANTTGTTNAMFNYDGFGNIRNLGGNTNVPTGTEGDFRFHGAWWEKGSDLYHMRAREYDQRLGRFTSRDPQSGDERLPETQHPYVYGSDNPEIYLDPSGEENLISLSAASLVQNLLGALRQIAIHEFKQEVKQQIAGAVVDFVMKELLAQYVPNGWKDFISKGIFAGNKFTEAGRKAFCKVLDESEWAGRIHFEVNVKNSGPGIGNPADNGIGCDKDPGWQGVVKPVILPGHSRPDFILGDPPLVAPGVYRKAYIVGDFKLTTTTIYRDYVDKHNIKQFNAIRAFAKNHTTSHTAIFIALSKDPKMSAIQNKVRIQYMKKVLTARLMRSGVIGGVYVARGK